MTDLKLKIAKYTLLTIGFAALCAIYFLVLKIIIGQLVNQYILLVISAVLSFFMMSAVWQKVNFKTRLSGRIQEEIKKN